MVGLGCRVREFRLGLVFVIYERFSSHARARRACVAFLKDQRKRRKKTRPRKQREIWLSIDVLALLVELVRRSNRIQPKPTPRSTSTRSRPSVTAFHVSVQRERSERLPLSSCGFTGGGPARHPATAPRHLGPIVCDAGLGWSGWSRGCSSEAGSFLIETNVKRQ